MENFENELVEQSYNEEDKVIEQNFTTESESMESSSLSEASNSNDSEANSNRRASIAISRFSSMIDPNIMSSWINYGVGYGSQAVRTKRRATMIDHSSVKSGFISLRSSNGVDFSTFNDEINDQNLPQEFENFLNEMNIQGAARENMLQLSVDRKRAIILTHRHSQELKQKSQPHQDNTQEQRQQQKNFLNTAQDYDVISDTSGKIQIRDSDVMSVTSATSENDNSEQKPNNRLSLAYWFYGTEQTRPSSPPLTSVPEQTKPAAQTTYQNGLFSSLLGLYPSAGNSAKSQDTPEFYIEKLTQKNASSKSLADTLLSLRITLSSAKLSWLREFIDNKGLSVLESILEKHTVRDKKRLAKTL